MLPFGHLKSAAAGGPGLRSSFLAGLVMLTIVTLCARLPLAAQDRDIVLRGEFPVDLMTPPSADGFSSVTQPGYVPQYPDAEQAAALLQDAAWQFSAMIWGWDFVYTPSDTTRQVQEYFTLQLRGSIAKGDPGLKVEGVRMVDSVIYADISYLPDAAARSYLQAWSSAVYPPAQGSASTAAFPANSGAEPAARQEQRHAAVSQAVKEAVRAYFRTVVFNKPREIRGSCVLSALPRIILRSGQYVATVRIRVNTGEIIPYSQY